ncbi:hypothetical protein [Chitinophaga sp. 212800010-3]|uniref:hypothetical protein n=1 Tax=unclassified Chitinophaga TaxID=2619133 RepID=UPI002DE3E999|nr:hypothetical protein [Chitinophaga sp. 212800010-3]
MKQLKLIFAGLLLLVCVSACKKDSGTNAGFDPAQYYIAGVRVVNYKTNFAIIFTPGGASRQLTVGGSLVSAGSYQYNGSHLKITDATFGDADLTIINNAITDYAGNTGFADASLLRIPGNDAFAGKKFQGQLRLNNESTAIACTIQFSTDSKFGFRFNSSDFTSPTAPYTLQNNAVATGNSNGQFLLVMANGKLLVSTSNDSNQMYGEFSQVI